jgi:hypothetical protein
MLSGRADLESRIRCKKTGIINGKDSIVIRVVLWSLLTAIAETNVKHSDIPIAPRNMANKNVP